DFHVTGVQTCALPICKTEAVKYLQQQEMQANAIQQEASTIQQAFEQAKLQEMYAKTASAIATARERHSRSDSNIGLFEERLAEKIGRASCRERRKHAR